MKMRFLICFFFFFNITRADVRARWLRQSSEALFQKGVYCKFKMIYINNTN